MRVVETSICILLATVCLTLCRSNDILQVPLWIIYLPVGAVVLFWMLALLITFIVWVLCLINEEQQKQEKNSRQNNVDKWTEEEW